MNSNIYYIAILLLGMLLTTSSCNKNNMPDENKDWNVLEWTVDGERYKAECEGDPLFGCDPVDCQYYNDVKSIELSGTNLNKKGIYIFIYENLYLNTETKVESIDEIRYTDGNKGEDCGKYLLDTTQNYILKIKELDTISKHIEGVFEFIGANNCLDTVKITNGYFKLSYRP